MIPIQIPSVEKRIHTWAGVRERKEFVRENMHWPNDELADLFSISITAIARDKLLIRRAGNLVFEKKCPDCGSKRLGKDRRYCPPCLLVRNRFYTREYRKRNGRKKNG